MEKIILTQDTVVTAFDRSAGEDGKLIVVQDDEGGHLITYKDGELGGNVILDTYPRSIMILEWIRDDVNVYWTSRIAKPGIEPTSIPTIRIDDYLDTLEVFHFFPDSEILMSVNNGPWVQYPGKFNIGAVDRPAGYWRFKVKEGVDRIESKIAYSLPTHAVKIGFPETLPFKLI